MTPERRAVLDTVAQHLVAVRVPHALRVAVDGITASGKTTFATELTGFVRALGRPCIHVTMDGFHHPRAVRYRQGRESATGYYEDAYDFAALRAVLLDPLGPDGDRQYRTAVLDLARDQPVDAPAVPAPEGLIVVVDGSFLQRPELRDRWDVVVYLRASFEAAGARGAERDAAQLGSVEEALRIFTVRYHAAHRRYLAEIEPEPLATLVVEHEDPARPAVVRSAADRPGRPTDPGPGAR